MKIIIRQSTETKIVDGRLESYQIVIAEIREERKNRYETAGNNFTGGTADSKIQRNYNRTMA